MAIIDTYQIPSAGLTTVISHVQGVDNKIYYSRADGWHDRVGCIDPATNTLKEVAMPVCEFPWGHTAPFYGSAIKPLGRNVLISHGAKMFAVMNKALTRGTYFMAEDDEVSFSLKLMDFQSNTKIWGQCQARIGTYGYVGLVCVDLRQNHFDYWLLPKGFGPLGGLSVDVHSKKVWFATNALMLSDNPNDWLYALGHLDLEQARTTTNALGWAVIGGPNREWAFRDVHAGGGKVWMLNYDQSGGGYFCTFDQVHEYATVHAHPDVRIFSSMVFNPGATNPTFLTRDGHINEMTGLVTGTPSVQTGREKFIRTGRVGLVRQSVQATEALRMEALHARSLVDEEILPPFRRWRLPGLLSADPGDLGTMGTDWVYADTRNRQVGVVRK